MRPIKYIKFKISNNYKDIITKLYESNDDSYTIYSNDDTTKTIRLYFNELAKWNDTTEEYLHECLRHGVKFHSELVKKAFINIMLSCGLSIPDYIDNIIHSDSDIDIEYDEEYSVNENGKVSVCVMEFVQIQRHYELEIDPIYTEDGKLDEDAIISQSHNIVNEDCGELDCQEVEFDTISLETTPL